MGTGAGQINDRLEFPLELNMYPYTKEGRAAAAAAESESSSSTRGSLEGSLSQSGDEIEVRYEQKSLILSSTRSSCCV